MLSQRLSWLQDMGVVARDERKGAQCAKVGGKSLYGKKGKPPMRLEGGEKLRWT
jgi:hypothetical protein